MSQNDTTCIDHVPNGLVYGPVYSRRFGHSLGISLTPIGHRYCTWSCPYCQLSHHQRKNPRHTDVAAEDVLSQLEQSLTTVHEAIDTITIAGSGEPSWHPRFRELVGQIVDKTHAYGIRVIVLSSGDGPGYDSGPIDSVETFIKWDPGENAGGWDSAQKYQERLNRFVNWEHLSIQAMLFQDANGGNITSETFSKWAVAMIRLRPDAIHLTTVDRVTTPPGIKPASTSTMCKWADRLRNQVPCQIETFPASKKGSFT